jgi:hypothetical protein
MRFLTSVRSEVLKTKRTAAFYFALAGGAIVPSLSLLDLCVDGIPERIQADPFNGIFRSEMNSLIIFPMFVILVCTLVPQIEHRNNTWKQVFTSPQRKMSVYLSKFLTVLFLMFLFLLSSQICFFLSAIVLHFVYPKLHLLNQSFDLYKVAGNAVNLFTFLLAVSALQFWIGTRFRNFIVSIGIGLAGWFVGTLLVLDYHSPAAKFVPYSLHTFSYVPAKGTDLRMIGLTSIGFTVLFLVLGFADFRNRKN